MNDPEPHSAQPAAKGDAAVAAEGGIQAILEEPATIAVLPDPTKGALKSLLELLKIKKVYYVDDEHTAVIDYEVISVTLSGLIDNGKIEAVRALGIEGLNVDLPPEEIAPVFQPTWNGMNLEQQKTIIQNLLSLSEDVPYQFDINRAERIKDLFPAGLLDSLDPHGWDAIKDTITNGIRRYEKVLVLFDQDLRGAGGRFLVTKGENLIKEIRTKPFRNQVVCTLLTHLIPGTEFELDYRETILNANKGQLRKGDFFALTKIRIDDNALLADGVKKTLLNKYCEFIKDNSIRIIKSANDKVLSDIKKMDTYDFDHTILRSSYSEGVWEAETLFRISRNLYDLEVKNLMIARSYPAKVNKQIKQAKAISDIRFTINGVVEPYAQKYKLRSHDIYEQGSIINPLHQPLENGDIFEVLTGKGKGQYILVGQECDLMMRTNPIGTRSAKLATLLPITVHNSASLGTEVLKHFQKHAEKNHYLSNRFPLEYFNYGTNDIGIVNLGTSITVDLDALDLTVFNTNGIAQINITDNFNLNLLNTSWEHRYTKLLTKYKKEALEQIGLLGQVPNLEGAFKTPFKNKIYLKLSPIKDFGPSATFDGTNTFTFGIKRIMRLKYAGGKYLLERYYKHLSRTAEQHDFAHEV